jgi:D-proline reductase (dithiol) PrdB
VSALAELPRWLRAVLHAYPWRRIDPVPCARLRRPLAECTVAVVSTAGLVPPGEPPFSATVRGGDFSYRTIRSDVDLRTLTDFHRSRAFDHRGIERDRNLALPLDRLRELAADAVIGRVAPRHVSFMGSITAPGRLTSRSAPAAAAILVDDAVDVALLVPV